MDDIRLGTIGSGQIVRSILDAVQKTGGISLEAVYSRSREKGKELAEKYGAGKVYTELEDMLADEKINFVYIASPNNLHYGQSKAVLLSGKNVICEKPFCTGIKQAKELFEIAEEKGLILVEAVPTSFLPNFAVLREAVNKIGRIRLVLANYSQYSSRYDKLLAGELPNVFNPAFAGGCLMDINYYNVYLTLALFGQPENAVYYPNMQGGVDTSGSMVMVYPGFVASLAGAKDCKGSSYYQIEGEEGCVYIKDGSNGLKEIRTVNAEIDETVNLQPDHDRWYYEIQNLVPILLREDKQELELRRELTLRQVAIVEQTRRAAGIIFPDDE